jgi:transcriptional regulator with XRE-family HTH domain
MRITQNRMKRTQGRAPESPADKPSLARRVRRLRGQAGLTLQQLSDRSGISISALSKIENAQLSPTYDKIVQLAKGLDVDLTRLFTDDQKTAAAARVSITRRGKGVRHVTANYDYEMLCTDVAHKKLLPLTARIKAKSTHAFGPLIAHEGEEVIYVISGRIELHTEHYVPFVLEAGDCAFFDSTMAHGCVAVGLEDADVFWVCSDQRAIETALDGGEKE